MPGTDPRYSYIWTSAKPPPWRLARWVVALAAGAIALFIWVEGATLELDPTLQQAYSLISQLLR